jgi:molybdopterin molybdotransferase
MISVSQADKILFESIPEFSFEVRPLKNCIGAILREDIHADRDLPAFDQALLDGIAVNFAEFEKGRREFFIEGVHRPGEKQPILKSSTGCFEIMTGAVVPKRCDCVIGVEQMTLQNGKAVVNHDVTAKQFQYIRPRQANQKKGDLLLAQGCVLNSVRIALAASVGKHRLKVSKKLKAALISTGDELVEIDAKNIKPFQIRKSNTVFLEIALISTGLFETKIFHFRDDEKALLREIKKILSRYDVLISSGGVSMGKFDFLPKVLGDLKVKVLFHKITQRPGKPFWFGKNKKGVVVFALPGNPVSTQVCLTRYVLPTLKKALGLRTAQTEIVKVNTMVTAHETFTLFQPAMLMNPGDVKLLSFGGSGDFASLADSSGFVEIPPRETNSMLQFYRWP